MLTSKEEIIKKLREGTYKTAAVIGHCSADPDSIASAFGVKFILKSLIPSIEVDFLVDGISNPAKKLVEYLETMIIEETNKKYDLIVIVDVNTPIQFGVFKDLILSQKKDLLIIIDHHTPSEFAEKGASAAFIDDERSSAAEMIAELIFDLALTPGERLLTALLAGIIYDSRRFYSLNLNLLKVIRDLIRLGANYDLAIKLIQKRFEYSEKVARIKCASRVKYKKIDKWLIAWSTIGAFEGSSARALLDLGADVALVYSNRKEETRVNVRARNEFYRETNIHFGKDVMSILGKEFQGEGGGHSTAAALNIPTEIPKEKLIKKALIIIEKKIRNNEREAKIEKKRKKQ